MSSIDSKIVLIGTLGAGKTTAGHRLSRLMNVPFASIDDCRRANSDGSRDGERRAAASFMRDCRAHRAMIVEFSGTGPHRDAVIKALTRSGRSIRVIWLDPPLAGCIRRAGSRRRRPAPSPFLFISPERGASSLRRSVARALDESWPKTAGFRYVRIRTDPIRYPEAWWRRVRLAAAQESGSR